MNDKAIVYENLSKYKFDSSWAIWSIPKDLNSKEGISDMEVFKNENTLVNAINCKYVFVGLNPSDQSSCSKCKNKDGCQYREDVDKNKDKPWYNFHSACVLKSQDYKLRLALHNTEEYWGSFITDIVPNIVDKDSGKISTIPTCEAIAKVKDIIRIMGRDIVFVAMGNKACTILKKIVPGDVSLKKITHYSTYIKPDDYKNRILSELENATIDKRIKCRRIAGKF